MKERVTLTLDEDILGRVDATINKDTIKNRSHAVEQLLRKALRGKVPSTAVILAGGKDSHAMNIVQGKPLLEHNIALLKQYGVLDIIITGDNYAQIHDAFGSGTELGVKLSYVEETTPLGTAGCLHLLQDRLTEPFIIMNGDDLKNINLKSLFKAHNQFRATITIGLTPTQNTDECGVAVLDGNNILEFLYDDTRGQSTLVNAGVYIVEPEVPHSIGEGKSMLEKDVFPHLARSGKLFGYTFAGQWQPTKNDEDIARAEKEWRGF